jgi:putative tryptophan/tyrosine transport system substrate-binding protein
MLTERRRLVDLAARIRLPAVYSWREFVAAGGLMSYGPNRADLYRRPATLRGQDSHGRQAKRAADEVRAIINLKAAKALGLTIPPSVRGRADQIIE